MTSILPPGLKWNQAKLGKPNHFTDGLLKIITFNFDRQPILLGNGFIIAAFGHYAIACTAAHLFTGIQDIQNPNPWHHPNALREFLPNGTPLNLDRKMVRAITFKEERVEAAVFDWVAWDEHSDIAFIRVRLQDHSKEKFFESIYEIDDSIPRLSEEVVILGFGSMDMQNEHRDETGFETFQVKSQLILRGGSVSKIHPNGYSLCKGKCIETTIPVMPGMSGSPVMKFVGDGERMRPFGVVSSSMSTLNLNAADQSVSGRTIVPLINSSVTWRVDGQRLTMLKLDEAFWARNPDGIKPK